MGKKVSYNMGKKIYEMASKPLRSKQEVILLLLYTIRMLDANEFIPNNAKVKVNIYVSKMNRVFYILEDKIFSMQFPFQIEIEKEKIIRIYDVKTGIDIDSIVTSVLIGIFEKSSKNSFSFEGFFDEIMEYEHTFPDIEMEQLWEMIKFLAIYDLGYLRYDYDEKNQNGLLHPINHLDICLDTAVTYKIGLEKNLDYETFKDILDTTTKCYFLKN